MDNSNKTYGEPLRVLTYNIQTGDVPEERARQVLGVIHGYDPDIMGLQEVNPDWYKMINYLGLLDEYNFIGRKRYGDDDDSRPNHYEPLLYRKGMFTEIESDTLWLSDTPEVPSKTREEAHCPRPMSYAVLKRNSDGAQFLCLNTHIDHTGKKPFEVAQQTKIMQVNILLSLVDKILQKHGDMPVCLIGDYNMLDTWQQYEAIIDHGYSDTHKVAENIGAHANKIIDFCFVSNGDFRVCESTFGVEYNCSDHKPLFTVVCPAL